MLLEAVTAIAALIAAGGVIYGFRLTNRDLREEKYARYTERYQKILVNLPYGIFDESVAAGETDDTTKKWLMAYIDLCAEELFDKQRHLIDDTIWEEWLRSILPALRSPSLKELLDRYRSDYRYLSEFVETEKVPKIMRDKKRKS